MVVTFPNTFIQQFIAIGAYLKHNNQSCTLEQILKT
jgi:hypothetical protein